ncbi:MAG: phage major capsid protein [Saprospiraceae bacterium]|nr:phage major capsid protein [Saprospiraceae bacterium]
MTIDDLIKKANEALYVMRDLGNRRKAESRDFTQDEHEQFDRADKDYTKYLGMIEEERKLAERERAIGEMQPIEERTHKFTGKNDPKQTGVSTGIDSPEYKRAFLRYCTQGAGALTSEDRSMLSAGFSAEFRGTDPITTPRSGVYGGYAIPTGFSNELVATMKQYGGMLQACRVLTTATGAPLEWPTVDDTAAVGAQQTEANAITVQDFTLGQKIHYAYTIADLIKVSFQWLEDEVLIASELPRMIGTRLGRKVNDLLTDGDGSAKPTGILAASGGAATGESAASAAISRDNIIDLIHSVDPAYRTGPSVAFMMADSTLAALKKLTVGTSDDRPLWQPDMVNGTPGLLEGYRIVINQDFPAIGAGNDSVAFGDWSRYIIRQVGGVNLLRLDERYADALSVGFVGWWRIDGKLMDASAIKLLTHAT